VTEKLPTKCGGWHDDDLSQSHWVKGYLFPPKRPKSQKANNAKALTQLQAMDCLLARPPDKPFGLKRSSIEVSGHRPRYRT